MSKTILLAFKPVSFALGVVRRLDLLNCWVCGRLWRTRLAVTSRSWWASWRWETSWCSSNTLERRGYRSGCRTPWPTGTTYWTWLPFDASVSKKLSTSIRSLVLLFLVLKLLNLGTIFRDNHTLHTFVLKLLTQYFTVRGIWQIRLASQQAKDVFFVCWKLKVQDLIKFVMYSTECTIYFVVNSKD